MLTGRTYIVADPTLCGAVQKASATMSFDPVLAEMTPRLVGLNAHTARVIRGPPSHDFVATGIIKKAHPILTTTLLPQNLHNATRIQLAYFSKVIAKVRDGSELDLFPFIRRAVTAATMTTFFGPNNPFEKHPELVEDFWDWESGNLAYMTGVLPSVFAREASRGLKACVKAFKEYIEEDGYKDAYKLVTDRYQLHLEEGITDTEELAKLEVVLSFGINSNASITMFWTLDQIYSRPELLSRIREEIRLNALQGPGELSSDSLNKACPHLYSAWRETLRLYVPSASARVVTADTMIADTWLLRKGAMVQLSGDVVHHNKEVWGPDASVFNPDRFLYSMNGSKTNPDGSVPKGKEHFIHSAAFRSFGGGVSLCPGRTLAAREILGLTAVLVMGFDMEPVTGTTWTPPADANRIPVAGMKPLAPLKVRMRMRKEFEGVKWELKP